MMLTSILAVGSAICWLLYLYPYLAYPAALRLFAQRPISPAPVRPSVSLLLCAYNEAECLPRKIENLRDLKRATPDLQILVYDDGSTDGSSELLARASDLLTTIRGPGRTGKAAGMKQLVRQAEGEILLFTDADVSSQADAIERLLPYYGDPDVGGVCCSVKMLNTVPSATSHTGSFYWSWDDRIHRLESATGNVMGASGAMFSVRRELYPDFPDTVQDDFTVSMTVIFSGKRLIKAPDVIAYTNSVSQSGEEVRRKARIGARAYHTHQFLRPRLNQMQWLDRFKYFSHKFLRWFGGLFVLGGTLLGLAAVASASVPAAGLLLVVGALTVALALRVERGVLAKLGQIGLATFATLYGVLKAMRGQTVTIWAPAVSR